MNKLRVYFASGFISMHNQVELANYLKEDSVIEEYYTLILPKLQENHYDEEFVYNDMMTLQQSDILIIHLPEPSIGASAELGYFRAIKPNNLIIAYRCIDHSWINKLASVKAYKKSQVLHILQSFVDSKTVL